MFRVGQKVVCVDARQNGWSRQWVLKGEIYIIAAIRSDDMGDRVDLVGVQKPNGFFPYRFRPLTDRKTSIEIFTRMLKPAGVDA